MDDDFDFCRWSVGGVLQNVAVRVCLEHQILSAYGKGQSHGVKRQGSGQQSKEFVAQPRTKMFVERNVVESVSEARI